MKNKTVRKIIAFIVAVTAAFALCACGTTEKKVETASKAETELVTEGETAEVTEVETEEKADETEAVTEVETEKNAAETEAETEVETEEETAAVTEAVTEAEADTEETAADTADETEADAGSLTADEEELVALLADDTTVITDDTYAGLVSEMQYHPGEFTGKAYQVEGVYTMAYNGETPYIYRTLVNGEEETFCGLPLVYSDKNIKEGTWVKATGIVNVHEIEGEEQIAFEIVAIQSMEEPGAATLEWNGSAHAH